MASPKLNLALNKDAGMIISLAANKMGTSKRNIISLALVEILKNVYDKRFIDSLASDITTTGSTATTISEQVQTKIEDIDRHGYSRRVFFGLLISDYFLNNRDKFRLEQDELEEEMKSKSHIEITIDKATKDKIISYCEQNAMTVSSLFSHYILNEEIKTYAYVISEKAHLNLILSENVKIELKNKAKSTNRTYRFYLNLVAEQIISNIST